ncbi:MAG: hypothetical protein EXS14_09740 [Planctomycetes bacterium]|nr:hypothetical protein [Planctomycetota bacterium]
MPTEQTRSFSSTGALLGKWVFPSRKTVPPYAALLLLANVQDPSITPSFQRELVHELATRGIAVWHGIHVQWNAETVKLAWADAAHQPLTSRSRVGLVAFGAALLALREATPALLLPRAPLFALQLGAEFLPHTEVASPAAEERRAAVALTTHIHAQLLPTWELAARRPGTAIG